MARKTGGNSGRFQKGTDQRRGVGKPGRSGRPPSVIRAQLRGSFADRVKILEAVADNEDAPTSDRIKALDMMAKYGLGTTSTSTDTEGNDAGAAGTLTPEEIKEQVRQILNGD